MPRPIYSARNTEVKRGVPKTERAAQEVRYTFPVKLGNCIERNRETCSLDQQSVLDTKK